MVHSKVQPLVTMKSHSARLQDEVSHELCIMYQSIGLFHSIFYSYRDMEEKFAGDVPETFSKGVKD